MKYHPYHLVDQSPWPMMLSCGFLTIVLGFMNLFNFFSVNLMMAGILISVFCALRWVSDMNDESNLGFHTDVVRKGFVMGFILFMMSEMLLFAGFFWSFFTNSLVPMLEMGIMWPPKSLMNPSPLGASTAGTALLLTSGAFLTWAHHEILLNNKDSVVTGFIYCFIFGELFVMIQASEYSMSPFTVSDSVLGSCFFLLTGLHGLHVMVGLSLLWLCFIRFNNFDMSNNKHIGFETAAWYWHFVDMVWLFVFSLMYAWSSNDMMFNM